MDWRKKTFTLPSLLVIPFLLMVSAIAIPYNVVAFSLLARRERKFKELMKGRGRTLDWAGFIRHLDNGDGTLIVERFSFEGPIRSWWVADNVRETCRCPLEDWFTMLHEDRFDEVRDWFGNRYTGATGNGLLVLGTTEQWRSIRGDAPRRFRDGVRWVEVPPPNRPAQ